LHGWGWLTRSALHHRLAGSVARRANHLDSLGYFCTF
jgi:hypothetical protein